MHTNDSRDEFGEVGERLRGACSPASALELDQLKVRIEAGAQRKQRNRGLFMKRRSVATVFSILGLAVAAVSAAVIVPQVGPSSPDLDAAKSQYGRGAGAPGRFCQQVGFQPGSPGFKNCVRQAAKARGQGRNGNKRGGNKSFPGGGSPGKFCKANGANPGSDAFKKCFKSATKAMAGGGARHGNGSSSGGAPKSCNDLDVSSEAFKRCVEAKARG